MPTQIARSDYAAMFGPTTGDRLRLADTDLIIEVERDLTAERAGASATGGVRGQRVALWGRGQVWRWQGDPRRDGAVASHAR